MINNQDKRKLKYIAHSTEIVKFNIGKDLIDNKVLEMLDNGIEKHELIKIAFLKSALENVNFDEAVLDLSANLHAEVVQKIGKTVILYRENKKSPLHIKL